ncbi:metal ABC transporter solute-binding protein, Zn/Mn family [Parapedobacter deserti]|uniref:Metal ABC transporter solute-binding protein, Zn/Mn family n=1 Tax=Parapedobacter deserti TaxID=1912957 RepID=A0ABV7JQD4_9SPHI
MFAFTMGIGFRVWSIIIFCQVVCLSCVQPDERLQHGKPYILTTTGMIADMLQHIVGDSATVEALMAPGVDPHLYKASQGDLVKILSADYLIYNGLHLEGKLASVLEKQHRTKPVIAVAEDLPGLIELNRGSYDPHIWFDVSLWKAATAQATIQLAKLDCANAAYYQVNAASYMAQLDSLDEWVWTRLNSLPEDRRVLITAHDAFGYFGRAYGFEVKGLQGISTLAEFGLQDVSALVNYIVERRIPAVFLESSVSDRALKAVMAGVRQRGGSVRIGGQLFSDAMGAPGTPQGTYIGMIKHNVNTIVEALL